MGMNFMESMPPINFPRRYAEAPMGEQMRSYVTGAGKSFMEAMVFQSWGDTLDLYYRHSTWPRDIWLCHEPNQSEPDRWYLSTTMKYKGRCKWPIPEVTGGMSRPIPTQGCSKI